MTVVSRFKLIFTNVIFMPCIACELYLLILPSSVDISVIRPFCLTIFLNCFANSQVLTPCQLMVLSGEEGSSCNRNFNITIFCLLLKCTKHQFNYYIYFYIKYVPKHDLIYVLSKLKLHHQNAQKIRVHKFNGVPSN